MRKGFTLIELSIVLVIIGLLVGGVLVGRDLIQAAGMRATIGQFEKYGAAMNAFKLKYNCMPGDCLEATNYNLGTATTGPGDNGNGNGTIHSVRNSMVTSWSTLKEGFNAWYHLASAGLVDGRFNGWTSGGTYTSLLGYAPPTKLRDSTYILAFSLIDNGISADSVNPVPSMGNIFFVTNDPSAPAGNFRAAFSASEMYDIDTKLDDGNPAAGRVRPGFPYSGIQVFPNSGIYSGCTYVVSGSETYDLKGLYSNYSGNVSNTPPNPNQLGCILVLGKAF